MLICKLMLAHLTNMSKLFIPMLINIDYRSFLLSPFDCIVRTNLFWLPLCWEFDGLHASKGPRSMPPWYSCVFGSVVLVSCCLLVLLCVIESLLILRLWLCMQWLVLVSSWSVLLFSMGLVVITLTNSSNPVEFVALGSGLISWEPGYNSCLYLAFNDEVRN